MNMSDFQQLISAPIEESVPMDIPKLTCPQIQDLIENHEEHSVGGIADDLSLHTVKVEECPMIILREFRDAGKALVGYMVW